MLKIAFPVISDIFSQNGLILNYDAELWALLGKICKKIVVNPKMSTIFSKAILSCLQLFPCLSTDMEKVASMQAMLADNF